MRLKKNWKNIELVPSGKKKLKIPTILLREKLRTQTRFNKMKTHKNNGEGLENTDCKQNQCNSALRKINNVIENFVIPMARKISTLPTVTHFIVKNSVVDDVFKNAVESIEREFPEVTKDKNLFMCSLQKAFDKFLNNYN